MKAQKIFLATMTLALGACAPTVNENTSIQSLNPIRWGKTADKADHVTTSTVAVIGGDLELVCSGTLLAPGYVLTAAHCVTEDVPMKVVFNENATKSDSSRAVTGAVVHPSYVDELTNHLGETNLDKADIAVVKYSGATPEGYQPAQILANLDRLKRDTYVTVAGYGVADDFPLLEGSRLTPSDFIGSGTGLLRYANVMIDNPDFSKTEVSVDQSWGKGICQGDSGGPAYISINNKLFLWGVASWGAMRAEKSSCAKLAVFTKVLPHLTFINKAVQALKKRQPASVE